ncbi:MAG: DUF1045 domain-containing protein [Rhodospirillales bacterium]
MSEQRERFAVYLIPDAASPLWQAGCRWLGRDPDRKEDSDPVPPGDNISGHLEAAEWSEITAEPRRYGFHATLKPPFALKDGFDLADLDEALARFAAHHHTVAASYLQVARLDGFLALRPQGGDVGLADLAAECVREFDEFRRPSDPAVLAGRRRAGLTARQETLLSAWGYPYVMEEFRFHMTLTGRLDDGTAARVSPLVQSMFAPALSEPMAVNGIALFHEATPGAPFKIIRRYRFMTA